MAKPRKSTKDVSNLVKALQFVLPTQKEKDGTPLQMHCRIANGILIASSGIISAGCKVEEDLDCCPHTHKLLTALCNCGQDELQITQMPNKALNVKSGKFTASVPCLEDRLPLIAPDANVLPVGEVLRESLGQVSHIPVEAAQKVILASVLMQSGSWIVTTGFVCLESYHGYNLPTCLLPKVFVNALLGTDKKLAGFGYGGNSVTFWFEDESWMKTQLYAYTGDEQKLYEQLATIITCPGEMQAVPSGFFEAVRQVEDFAEGGREKGSVYCTEFGVQTHRDESQGASYECAGLPVGFGFKIKQLKQVEQYCEKVHFANSRMWLQKGNVRGVVMGVN